MQVSKTNTLIGTLLGFAVLFMSSGLHQSDREFREANSSEEAVVIIQNVISSVNSIRSLSFTMDLVERNKESELNKSQSKCKIQLEPRSSYINIVEPKDGPEVLFREGVFGGKAVINPNSFPYFNLYLNPQSSIMRGDFHHSVDAVGIIYFSDVMDYLLNEHPDFGAKNLVKRNDTLYRGREHYVVNILNPEFHYKDYEVKAGENVTSIANKFFVNDYKIVMANEDVDDYNDVEAGQIIKIPNFYGKFIVLFVDKETHIPSYQYIEDEEGFYALYEYTDVVINPDFSQEDFSLENENYGF